MSDLTDQQVLAKIAALSKTCGAAGKTGMSAEKERAVWVKEATKRGLLGYPLKRKYREK